MKDFQRFIDIMVPGFKPVSEWNEEDKRVAKLFALGVVLFLIGSMI